MVVSSEARRLVLPAVVVLLALFGVGAVGAVAVPAAASGARTQRQLGLRSRPPGPTSTTIQRLHSDTYAKGECLTWRRGTSGATSAKVVPCNTPHLMEMVGARPLMRARRYPSPDEWSGFVKGACTAPLARYWNHAVDPVGVYEVTAIIPLESAWSQGDQRVQCSISSTLRDASGQSVPLTARADANNQALLYPVGTCLGTVPPGAGFSQVDCGAPHLAEVTGAADLTGLVEHAPSAEELSGLLHAQCVPAAEAYLGRPLDGDLVSGQLEVAPESWAAGTRKVSCILGRRSGDGRTFAALAAPLRSGG